MVLPSARDECGGNENGVDRAVLEDEQQRGNDATQLDCPDGQIIIVQDGADDETDSEELGVESCVQDDRLLDESSEEELSDQVVSSEKVHADDQVDDNKRGSNTDDEDDAYGRLPRRCDAGQNQNSDEVNFIACGTKLGMTLSEIVVPDHGNHSWAVACDDWNMSRDGWATEKSKFRRLKGYHGDSQAIVILSDTIFPTYARSAGITLSERVAVNGQPRPNLMHLPNEILDMIVREVVTSTLISVAEPCVFSWPFKKCWHCDGPGIEQNQVFCLIEVLWHSYNGLISPQLRVSDGYGTIPHYLPIMRDHYWKWMWFELGIANANRYFKGRVWAEVNAALPLLYQAYHNALLPDCSEDAMWQHTNVEEIWEDIFKEHIDRFPERSVSVEMTTRSSTCRSVRPTWNPESEGLRRDVFGYY